ncbi:glycerate dehydrogenase [Hypoxylon sp. FL1150]|nr:glycerate dehydrogenase [Hypoxylon sp. FL1150]
MAPNGLNVPRLDVSTWVDIAKSYFSHIAQMSFPYLPSVIASHCFQPPTNEPHQPISNHRLAKALGKRTPFPQELLRALLNLKLLLATGAQFKTFDLAAAAKRGISVATAPGGESSGREAGILALKRNVAADKAARRRAGQGLAVAVGAHWQPRLRHARGETPSEEKVNRKAEAPTFATVTKDELFAAADVVNLHQVLSEPSRGIVGAKKLEQVKESAVLIEAFRGHIRGAALDEDDMEALARR